MRQFAANRNRAALIVRSRATGEVVGRITAKAPRGYSSNATQMSDAALNRKRRK